MRTSFVDLRRKYPWLLPNNTAAQDVDNWRRNSRVNFIRFPLPHEHTREVIGLSKKKKKKKKVSEYCSARHLMYIHFVTGNTRCRCRSLGFFEGACDTCAPAVGCATHDLDLGSPLAGAFDSISQSGEIKPQKKIVHAEIG